MLEHRGSIDVVPLEEQFPSYMEMERDNVILTFSDDFDELLSRYHSNKYAQTAIDLLYIDHGRTCDDVEEFIRFMADHQETKAFVRRDVFSDNLVQ